MYPRKKFDGDPFWKYEERPPADLIKSLHLEAATIDQDEFWRAEWFWSRRPQVLSESVSFFFFYLTVAVCLFYVLPDTIPLLLLWIVAGQVAPFSMVFISTGGERNTSQVLHGSLFICRNENEALRFHCHVRLSQRGCLLVRLKPRRSIRWPARLSAIPYYWYIEEQQIPRLAENGALRPTLSLRPLLANQRKSSTEQQISKDCSVFIGCSPSLAARDVL